MLSVAIGWIVVMLALAELLATSQAHARRDVAQKLATRTQAGAEFSSLYVRDILAREREQAVSWLTVRRPARLSLARASEALDFSAALPVDRGGRVLQTAPARAGFIGLAITGLDPYLAPAIAGRAVVSNVVQSASGLPVVATAVSFATASGRRVLSGTFDVSKSPLGGYMRHVIVVPRPSRVSGGRNREPDRQQWPPAQRRRDSQPAREPPRPARPCKAIGHVLVNARRSVLRQRGHRRHAVAARCSSSPRLSSTFRSTGRVNGWRGSRWPASR
jgi:hypothetical protein